MKGRITAAKTRKSDVICIKYLVLISVSVSVFICLLFIVFSLLLLCFVLPIVLDDNTWQIVTVKDAWQKRDVVNLMLYSQSFKYHYSLAALRRCGFFPANAICWCCTFQNFICNISQYFAGNWLVFSLLYQTSHLCLICYQTTIRMIDSWKMKTRLSFEIQCWHLLKAPIDLINNWSKYTVLLFFQLHLCFIRLLCYHYVHF